MCLLVLAWKVHPRYRLVAAANRDEFHARPAAPLDWWNEAPQVLAGRDLQGGGTWMGVSNTGRFGVVTNFRELERPVAGAPTRGTLVRDYLAGTTTPAAYLDALANDAGRYAGFNLLLGDGNSLRYYSNRNGGAARELEPGIYGLSNHWLDSPWPKLLRTRAAFAALLAAAKADEVAPGPLFDLLADREPADPDETPDTGLPPDWERALSSPFVIHDRYGTRCSTLVFDAGAAGTVVHERRFDAAGRQTGATRLTAGGVAP